MHSSIAEKFGLYKRHEKKSSESVGWSATGGGKLN